MADGERFGPYGHELRAPCERWAPSGDGPDVVPLDGR
jgi:hypothetical protein